jgi:hypothetical protein
MCSPHEVELLSAAYKAYNGTIRPEDCMALRHCSVWFEDEIALMYWPNDVEPEMTCTESWPQGFERHNVRATLPSLTRISPKVVVMTGITFAGKDLYGRSIRHETVHPGDSRTTTASYTIMDEDGRYILPSTMLGTFTFTSPTVYIAHRPLKAMKTAHLTAYLTLPNGTSILATKKILTRSNGTEGVFAAKTEEVSSLRRRVTAADLSGTRWAQSVAAGQYEDTELQSSLVLQTTTILYPNSSSVVENRARSMRVNLRNNTLLFYYSYAYETLPLNFKDLQNPVPTIDYFRIRPDCWGTQTHCGTITDDTYRPKLWINNSFWMSMLPSTSGCYINTAEDPPIALVAISDDDADMEAPVFPKAPQALTTPSSVHAKWDLERPQPAGVVELGAPTQTSGARENQSNGQKLGPHHNSQNRGDNEKPGGDPGADNSEVRQGYRPTLFTGGSDRQVSDSLITALASSLAAIGLLVFVD